MIKDATYKFNMLDRHAHDFCPFIINSGRHFKNIALFNMKWSSKKYGVVFYWYDLFALMSRLAKINWHVPDRILQNVCLIVTLRAILLEISRVLSSLTVLMYAYQIRNVNCRRIRLLGSESFRNRRIEKVLYCCGATRCSMVSHSRNILSSLFSLLASQYGLLLSRLLAV